jgi:tetratricopeptide (TPR) repeat protein
LNRIALQRLDEAARYLAHGEIELAQTELEGALETAVDPGLRERAERELNALESAEAVATAASHAEAPMSDEDRLAILAGGWEDEQAAEYERYGQPFFDALLQLSQGEAADAVRALQRLLESHGGEPGTCYLHLELGRALYVHAYETSTVEQGAGQDDAPADVARLEAAAAAFRRFLETVPKGTQNEPVLSAYMNLARIADQQGDFPGSVKAMERAIEALEDDFRPYYFLGQFLRQRGHHQEALEILEAGASLIDEGRPDTRFLHELGLAYAGSGKREQGVEVLEGILKMMAARAHLDFPPDTTVALAKLHEEAGRPERAADLYRTLSDGSDTPNHHVYYAEAARLLAAMDRHEDARRLLHRAIAVAPTPERKAELEEMIRGMG